MQRFLCEQCANEVEFDASSCPVCSTPLGYLPGHQTLRALRASSGGVSYSVAGEAIEYWRCLNASWGCNWVLPAGRGATWCRSCALTRGRPDEARPDAIDAWSMAEGIKRRLVHQLDQLALPVEPRSPTNPSGLVFDLVHVPGQRGLTGHLDGVVTIDLTEADPVLREELRSRLQEPYRTLIGNLRHEIAHHYWHQLVAQDDHLTTFRALFGDERADYAAAIDRHYATPDAAWDSIRFVSRYAQAHPHEDWAETFAHYLHVTDLLDTASAHGLGGPVGEPGLATQPRHAPFLVSLQRWRPIALALDHMARSVGSARIYPVDQVQVVIDKLEFVHSRIMDNGRCSRSPDDPDAMPTVDPCVYRRGSI
jgi:hypothetical protein